MSQEDRRKELAEKTRDLLHGTLKHVQAAALAAALVPVASVAAGPAQTPPCPPSGGCPPDPPSVTVPSPCDFITAGGFVLTDSGAKANFGAHGGCKHEAFWGHVNYVDHGGFAGVTPYHVGSTDITGYLADPVVPNSRDICGIARTNAGEIVRCRVRMADNGEPGILDLFGIRLSNGYHVITRPLGTGGGGGGNVQLHKSNPASTPPNPVPTEDAACEGVAAP